MSELTLREQGIEAVREYFNQDKYCKLTGCELVAITEDSVVCELSLREDLLNSHGHVMGGAMFTLADFALAIASNLDGKMSVAVECNIRYYTATRGTKLIAVAKEDREGKTLGHYTVEVSDDLGKKIAGFTAIVAHVG